MLTILTTRWARLRVTHQGAWPVVPDSAWGDYADAREGVMPDKLYPIRLNPFDPEADMLYCRIVHDRGVLEHFSIQYQAVIGDADYPIVRYDTSHGTPHRHVLDRFGQTVRKDFFSGRPFKQALNDAQADLKANWRRYRAEFIEREGLSP